MISRRQDTDTQFGMMTDADGERVRSIPRFYTNRVDAKDVSRDIAASMAQFTHMANLFEEKSKTVGLVESMMSIHEQRLTILEMTLRLACQSLTRYQRARVCRMTL